MGGQPGASQHPWGVWGWGQAAAQGAAQPALPMLLPGHPLGCAVRCARRLIAHLSQSGVTRCLIILPSSPLNAGLIAACCGGSGLGAKPSCGEAVPAAVRRWRQFSGELRTGKLAPRVRACLELWPAASRVLGGTERGRKSSQLLAPQANQRQREKGRWEAVQWVTRAGFVISAWGFPPRHCTAGSPGCHPQPPGPLWLGKGFGLWLRCPELGAGLSHVSWGCVLWGSVGSGRVGFP